MKSWADEHLRKKIGCGFVPTLGAMHEGHGSLIKRARKENGQVVVSVFVNPYQFRKKQYLDYPRDLEADARLADDNGANVLFVPSAKQMYPENYCPALVVLPEIFRRLKKQKLGWHYKAVLTVVMKFFGIVRPNSAYFGMKDPHQLALIKMMVENFNLSVKIEGCPTIRERDGLARSSRNAFLTPKERKAAPVIYRALKFGRDDILKKGHKVYGKTIHRMEAIIAGSPPAKADHIEITDAGTLLPLDENSREALIFASVKVGGQRLTDNLRFRLKRGRL